MQVYLVGGAVRDQLLGYPFSERDWVVVGATPEQITQQGYTPVGKDFPVYLHPVSREEYALARTERKTGNGYTGFSFNTHPEVTLEEDLARRDLTINAMAQTEDGNLIDPYDGANDLTNKTLRHVSEAFAEDPVRILRVARFAARYHHLGFTVAPETLDLMRAMVNQGEVDHLVPERVWKEFEKALTEKNPSVFIQTLKACGALKKILPEIDALFGVPQPAEHHPEIDTGEHSLLTLQASVRLSPLTEVRFAALVHDLGKALTPSEQWPRHHQHEQLGLEPVRELCRRLCIPNDYRELALLGCEHHLNIHRALELKPSTVHSLLKKADALRKPERFAALLVVAEADSRGRKGMEHREYPQRSYLAGALRAAQAVTATKLIAQGWQGAELGKQLEQARIEALTRYKANELQDERHPSDNAN